MTLNSVRWLIVLALAVGGVAIAGRGGSVRAQQPGEFEVVIPASTLNTPWGPNGGTLGQAIARVTAVADGVVCTSADLTTTTDVVVRLGAPGQPPACAQNGAKVLFYDGHCNELTTEMTLTIGSRQQLSNVAPKPPGSAASLPGCIRPPEPTPSVQAQVLPAVPPGGIAPPNRPTPAVIPSIMPPQTGDAGLASRRR